MKLKKAEIVEELHKPARRNYTRRHDDIRGLNKTWQVDLVEMRAYANVNKDYSKVQRSNPVTYKLMDVQNQQIESGFYQEELQKVKCPDVYLVEKVLKTKGNKKYVKWMGFDNTHNSWINNGDL
ncbi:uncharacterized protein LOC107040844 [Diachasma alloeum]|uniref:uncharacterized protein LOC107040844 n=1 Tax=Diachasma alloeum TaxID=454923 RepID=UPI00073840C7|nr:uncharacterized protein LOC107040844 [Diachasma alloeum]